MPTQRFSPVWFRLLVRVPVRVEFPTVKFDLYLAQDIAGSWLWDLRAHDLKFGGEVRISEDFREKEWLEEALYHDGFAARHATTGETILLKMVQTGAAEKLVAPLRPPEYQRGLPWAWF